MFLPQTVALADVNVDSSTLRRLTLHLPVVSPENKHSKVPKMISHNGFYEKLVWLIIYLLLESLFISLANNVPLVSIVFVWNEQHI